MSHAWLLGASQSYFSTRGVITRVFAHDEVTSGGRRKAGRKCRARNKRDPCGLHMRSHFSTWGVILRIFAQEGVTRGGSRAKVSRKRNTGRHTCRAMREATRIVTSAHGALRVVASRVLHVKRDAGIVLSTRRRHYTHTCRVTSAHRVQHLNVKRDVGMAHGTCAPRPRTTPDSTCQVEHSHAHGAIFVVAPTHAPCAMLHAPVIHTEVRRRRRYAGHKHVPHEAAHMHSDAWSHAHTYFSTRGVVCRLVICGCYAHDRVTYGGTRDVRRRCRAS